MINKGWTCLYDANGNMVMWNVSNTASNTCVLGEFVFVYVSNLFGIVLTVSYIFFVTHFSICDRTPKLRPGTFITHVMTIRIITLLYFP